ncbi:hypothetical protein HGRIS_005069 [Hohenbuehelia grisea]|uniref:Fungal lipase-type domain-containing protein n=1 Tax=Hohenbuehelia grisea TaxID=104357 RepID=A0ABR3JEC7_9AGAR
MLPVLLLAFISSVAAFPLFSRRQSITALSAAQVSTFTPYTYYASTAYCEPAETLTWSCGANCQSNAGFQPVASGGDGEVIQFWYVGFDPTLKTIIVAHQGTDTSKFIPLLTISDIFYDNLDHALFPGISSAVKVHKGFGAAQARAAPEILTAVRKAMDKFSSKSVTLVGHSLGGAIALIDAVFLKLHLPKDIELKTFTYGMPRVGNQYFADYVDKNIPNVVRITNKMDPVPIMPGRFLGFRHAGGEIHITDDNGTWNKCPGQDNTAAGCTVEDVRNILIANKDDHAGPYNGVRIRC